MLFEKLLRVLNRVSAETVRNAGITSRITAMFRFLLICFSNGSRSDVCGQADRCIGRPASSDVRIVSRFTGARRKISSPSASESAFKIAPHPPPTGGSPMPRAPTGVSGSGMSSAAHCMLTGTSRIVGGLVWWKRLDNGRPYCGSYTHFWPIAWPMPRIERPSTWPPSACGWITVPTSAHGQKIDDVILAGFEYRLRPRQSWRQRKRSRPSRGYLSLATATSPWPASAAADALVYLLMSSGSFVAVVDAAELDGALRGLRQGHARPAALAEHALVGDFVILGLAAEVLGRDFLQLLFRVHGGRVRRTRHGVGGLAAAGNASPRQILGRVAPGDVALFPGHAEHFGDHAVHVADRLRSEIADAGLDVDPAIGLDDEQARRIRWSRRQKQLDRHAHSANFRAAALRVRAFRSFHLNCSAPRSSASLMNALVDMRSLAVRCTGPNGALPSGR